MFFTPAWFKTEKGCNRLAEKSKQKEIRGHLVEALYQVESRHIHTLDH
jgi:hypothetical protein